jgi:outer membrane protein W
VDGGGFTGSLFYSYWSSEALALNLSIGGMAVDIKTESSFLRSYTETVIVSQFLVGAKYYFLPATYSSNVRPFVSAGIGPFIGSHDKVKTGPFASYESRIETALGGQIGAGLDMAMGRYFMTGFSFAYNLQTDFDEPIGGSDNYGGPVFGIGFSVLFGKGVN